MWLLSQYFQRQEPYQQAPHERNAFPLLYPHLDYFGCYARKSILVRNIPLHGVQRKGRTAIVPFSACPVFSSKTYQTSLKTSSCSSDAPIIQHRESRCFWQNTSDNVNTSKYTQGEKSDSFRFVPYSSWHQNLGQANPMPLCCCLFHTDIRLPQAETKEKNSR